MDRFIFNQKPPVIGLAGWSGSGKTTLLVKLIPALKEAGKSGRKAFPDLKEAVESGRKELRIGVIKHDAHGISLTPVGDHPDPAADDGRPGQYGDMSVKDVGIHENETGFPASGDRNPENRFFRDKPGKDSCRFQEAGADRVILSGPEGTFITCENAPDDTKVEYSEGSPAKGINGSLSKCRYLRQLNLSSSDDLDSLLEYLQDMDLILVEGYKQSSLPRIGIARRDSGKGLTSDPGRFLAVVTDDPEVRESCLRDRSVPVFGPDQVRELAQLITETADL